MEDGSSLRLLGLPEAAALPEPLRAAALALGEGLDTTAIEEDSWLDGYDDRVRSRDLRDLDEFHSKLREAYPTETAEAVLDWIERHWLNPREQSAWLSISTVLIGLLRPNGPDASWVQLEDELLLDALRPVGIGRFGPEAREREKETAEAIGLSLPDEHRSAIEAGFEPRRYGGVNALRGILSRENARNVVLDAQRLLPESRRDDLPRWLVARARTAGYFGTPGWRPPRPPAEADQA